MASFRANWITQGSSEFDQWVDIDPDVFTGTISSVTRGFSAVVGGAHFGAWISNFTSEECFLGEPCPVTPPSLPPDADPPFPPVYPYLFASEDIYGRDNLSLNIKMVRGDTYQFDATIVQNGTPVDLTGGTVRMTAKWAVSNADSAAIFQLSSATSGITITDATAGEISVVIAHSLTTSMPSKKVELPYDIQYVDSEGNVFTVLYGTLTIVPDVTVTA